MVSVVTMGVRQLGCSLVSDSRDNGTSQVSEIDSVSLSREGCAGIEPTGGPDF